MKAVVGFVVIFDKNIEIEIDEYMNEDDIVDKAYDLIKDYVMNSPLGGEISIETLEYE